MSTVSDLVRKPASEGYRMILDRGWPELTFDAVALKHPDRFEPSVLSAAEARLCGSGALTDATFIPEVGP